MSAAQPSCSMQGGRPEAIRSGQAETVLIVYGSLQKSQAARALGGRPAMFSNQWDIPAGLPLPVGALCDGGAAPCPCLWLDP